MNHKYYGNEQYYLYAFERLDAVGKHTWNWPAFFFGPCWLAYRKMYAYSFLALLLTYPIFWTMLMPICTFAPFFSFAFILGGFPLLAHIFLGIFGNALYYRIIRKRIVQGYHLLENFRPTSIPCGLSCGLLGFISFVADEYIRRKYFQTVQAEKNPRQTDLDFEISSDNIGGYLNEFREKHVASWIADIVICLGLITPPIIVPMMVSHYSIKTFDQFERFDDSYDNFYHYSHFYKKWRKDTKYPYVSHSIFSFN